MGGSISNHDDKSSRENVGLTAKKQVGTVFD
jgi:hypothetical protein